MNKKILAAAIAASFVAAPAMAKDNVTITGEIRQSVDFVDQDNGEDEARISNKNSNLKISGSEDLGNGLKAIFTIHTGVRASGGNDTSGSEFGGADTFGNNWNVFAGLAGDFGTFLIGRHDHPVKMSTGRLDIFANTVSDNAGFNLGNSYQNADLRADGTLAYVSPSFSGLTIAAAIVPGEYTTLNADGLADAWSVAAMYSNGGLYATVAHEQGDKDINALATEAAAAVPSTLTCNAAIADVGADATAACSATAAVAAAAAASAADDYDQTRVGIGYTMDEWHVNLVYTNEDGIGNFDSYKLAGSYTMGNNVLKAHVWDRDNDGAVADDDGWAIGLDHNFSKRTQAQVIYDSRETGNVDNDTFSIGLNHKF